MGSMKHAIGTEKRTATELESDGLAKAFRECVLRGREAI
jgi:hypothetical protein